MVLAAPLSWEHPWNESLWLNGGTLILVGVAFSNLPDRTEILYGAVSLHDHLSEIELVPPTPATASAADTKMVQFKLTQFLRFVVQFVNSGCGSIMGVWTDCTSSHVVFGCILYLSNRELFNSCREYDNLSLSMLKKCRFEDLYVRKKIGGGCSAEVYEVHCRTDSARRCFAMKKLYDLAGASEAEVRQPESVLWRVHQSMGARHCPVCFSRLCDGHNALNESQTLNA